MTIFPRALYQLPLESVPATTSHLSPFPSTEGHRDGASSASALDLLPHRPLPLDWSCFPVGHYLRTGAAPSVGQYLRRAATWMIDHGRSRYAKSILFAQSFPLSSSSMEPIVGLYSPSCQQPVTSQTEVLLSHNKLVPATRHSLPNKIRTHTHTQRERERVGE